MSVKFFNAEMLSASSKKRDPQKYKWYQLAKGKAKFDSAHKEFELELRKGEKFGLKFYRGSYFLVDEDDLTVQFKLSVEEGKKLIEASKPFSGKIAGKQVEGGDAASGMSSSAASDVAQRLFGKSARIRKSRDGVATFSMKGAAARKLSMRIDSRASEQGLKAFSPKGVSTFDENAKTTVGFYKDTEGNVVRTETKVGASPSDYEFFARVFPKELAKKSNKDLYPKSTKDTKTSLGPTKYPKRVVSALDKIAKDSAESAKIVERLKQYPPSVTRRLLDIDPDKGLSYKTSDTKGFKRNVEPVQKLLIDLKLWTEDSTTTDGRSTLSVRRPPQRKILRDIQDALRK